MKNLENYGVQKLNAKEITEIDGGSLPPFNPGALLITTEFIANEVSDFIDGVNLYFSL